MDHHWTQSLSRSRYVWDTVLLAGFIIVMAPHATTIAGHEWLSVFFLVPFTIHLLLHWQWIRQTATHFMTSTSVVNRWHFALDCLLYLTMTFAIVSGFLASEALFVQMGISFTPDPFWTVVHHQYSNLLFPIVGINIAVHWDWVVR